MSDTPTFSLDHFYIEVDAYDAYLDLDSLVVQGHAGDGCQEGRLLAVYTPEGGADYVVTRNEDHDDSDLDLDYPQAAHVWLTGVLAELYTKLLAERNSAA